MAREKKATDEQIIAALLANGTLRAAAIIRHGINRGSAAADTFLLTGRIKRQRIRGRTPQGQAFFICLQRQGREPRQHRNHQSAPSGSIYTLRDFRADQLEPERR